MKIHKFLTTISILAYTLSACTGVTEISQKSNNNATTPSILECFKATRTVNYLLTSTMNSKVLEDPIRSTFGPMTFNGQAVTGQTIVFPRNNSQSNYWLVTRAGVTYVASLDNSKIIEKLDTFYPSDMSPGQKVKGKAQTPKGTFDYFMTLVGFEDITVAGKVFSNTCHFIEDDKAFNALSESWFAPGYGIIKQKILSGKYSEAIIHYKGDH